MALMDYYPVFMNLTDRACLVVGGGNVAEGKVQGLLAAHAAVTVVSPQLSNQLRDLVQSNQIQHVEREYDSGDIDGQDLCFVATDDGAINARVATDCRDRGIWVNAADDPPNCDFILPSVVRSGKIVVAASTGGSSPAMARRLREELTVFLAEDYAPLADLLAEVRIEVRAGGLRIDPEVWARAIDARLRTLVAQGRLDEARDHLRQGLGVASPQARQES